MWQEIIKNAKDALSGDLKNKADLNDQQAKESVELAGESTKEVLTEEAKKGNIQQITDLFSGRKPSSSDNPLVQKIGSQLVGKLVNQLGLSKDTATTVERTVVPYLLDLLNKKSGGTGNSPSAQHILSMLGGADILSGGIQDKIKKGLGGFFK
ncbi:hypothetical protein [Nafulsella turpanensis]|uniref:hypothetical protein n=1 Tax=Nafulsella turpanensis TaxID=1265690 RepID=UPI00034C4975|nr:hypothetical protein [Nafulsella turpanensis]